MTARLFYSIPLVVLLTTVSGATDWSTCQDDLDLVKRAAEDASDAAEELDSKGKDLEDKRSELQNCISFPNTYDLWRDRCQTLRGEYEDAKNEYDWQKDNLESELSTLESRLRSVLPFRAQPYPGTRVAL